MVPGACLLDLEESELAREALEKRCGGIQTGVGGGMNGDVERKAMTHSFKRLGFAGGARLCMAGGECGVE